jgi:hypothetical protein
MTVSSVLNKTPELVLPVNFAVSQGLVITLLHLVNNLH